MTHSTEPRPLTFADWWALQRASGAWSSDAAQSVAQRAYLAAESKYRDDDSLVAVLIARGWRWGVVCGHGDSEPVVSDGGYVIADVEKVRVLIPPAALFDEPVTMKEYFGW